VFVLKRKLICQVYYLGWYITDTRINSKGIKGHKEDKSRNWLINYSIKSKVSSLKWTNKIGKAVVGLIQEKKEKSSRNY
jgi:hypothetical protein